MRILIIKRDPTEVCAQVEKCLPGSVVEHCGSSAELASTLSAFRPDVAFVFKIGMDPTSTQALVNCPSLKWIHAATTGVDHLVPWDHRIRVTNSAGVHDEVLANYVLGAILMVNTYFQTFRDQQYRREWKSCELNPTSGQKLTVVGFGRIGSRISRIAKTFGMAVTGVRTQSGTDKDAVRILGFSSLLEAVADADFVTVTLPLTPSTTGMVDQSVIDAMRRGAWLINISRGGIVDEEALRAALERDHLGGAFMDVFSTEPLPASSKNWSTKNLFITPHTGDAAGWENTVCELFCENLRRFLNGQPLLNLVEAGRGY